MSYTDLDDVDNDCEEMEANLDDAMTVDDFGFIIGPDGEIKAVFMPDVYDSLPHSVERIFKIFGVSPLLMAQTTSTLIH